MKIDMPIQTFNSGPKNHNESQSGANIMQQNLNNTLSFSTLKNVTNSENPTNGLSKNDVKKIVQKINESIAKLSDKVQFSYNEDAKSLVVKVIDSKTGQVIRQIPPEELIKLEANLSQTVGMIFNKEVK